MVRSTRLTFYNWFTRLMPDCGRLNGLRCFLLRWCGVSVGNRCDIAGTVRLSGWGEISIGDDVRIREGVLIKVGGGRIHIGNKILIAANVILESIADETAGGLLEIGNDVDVMMQSVLSANGNAVVRIGSHCKIAHNVSIKATHHRIDVRCDCIGDNMLYDDITISDGCWICAGAIITPGVTIGEKNVVAAGAVVTHDTPPHVLVAGVPAVLKKDYAV